MAELKVSTFATCFSANENLRANHVFEILNRLVFLYRFHLAMEDIYAPTFLGKDFCQISLGFPELGEYEHFLIWRIIEQHCELFNQHSCFGIVFDSVEGFNRLFKKRYLCISPVAYDIDAFNNVSYVFIIL